MPIDRFRLQHLAIPAVIVLIAFLAYGSQILLFPHLDPADLTSTQKRNFNILVGSIWISYYRAVKTDPGQIPKEEPPHVQTVDGDSATVSEKAIDMSKQQQRQRWCRKCERTKPARAHHCKVCKRCIPKMDHHCIWISNCVSHFTLPHFIRFLFYATTSMVYLQYFYFIKASVIWDNRALPSYLGPSFKMLSLLTVFFVINSLTLFGVGIMFLRSIYDIAINSTTIESWEISRHQQLLRRAKTLGGFLYGPDGQEIRIKRQEFPYDIGIWANLCQAMGTANPLAWFWVFAKGRTPGGQEGVVWKTNGFEDENIGWPPPDPDRMPRNRPWGTSEDTAFVHEDSKGYGELSPREELEAFKQRQEADLARRRQNKPSNDHDDNQVRRRKRFHDRFDSQMHQSPELGAQDNSDSEESGEEGWRDGEGNRLNDLGVDEDVEFYDEDDIPLGELIKRRRQQETGE